MIVVNVTTEGLTADGHAGYAEAGSDIVCAGISTLVQNLVYSLEALTEDLIQYNMEPGHMEVKYKDLSDQGRLLVDSFFIGVSGISAAYPEYVKLI